MIQIQMLLFFLLFFVLFFYLFFFCLFVFLGVGVIEITFNFCQIRNKNAYMHLDLSQTLRGSF